MVASTASCPSATRCSSRAGGGSAIYRGTLGGKFEVAYAELKGPADIGFDSKRKRVLVPRLVDNAIGAYDLK